MTRRSTTKGLWLLFGLQALCAAFFFVDGLLGTFGISMGLRQIEAFEIFVAFALIGGVIMTGLQIRRAHRRQARLEDQVRVASGEFAELLEEHFDQWGLTEAERDVAILSIKGMSVAEIAEARSVKEGTIKAQNAALYRKAGVSGRLQLLSLFIDELMAAGTMTGRRV